MSLEPIYYYLIASTALTATATTASVQANSDRATFERRQAEQEARVAAAAAEQEAATRARQSRLLRARQLAQFAGAGVDIEGTPLDVISTDAVQSELNVLNATFEGQLARSRALNRGRRATAEGRAANTGAILGGASRIAGRATALPALNPSGGGTPSGGGDPGG